MFHCGYMTGLVSDPSRPNWQNTGKRPIAWSAWYPTSGPQAGQPSPQHFHEMGEVYQNAPFDIQGQRPVVLISHGTGGTAEGLGWLARAFVREGYVVLGPNHHGNTGLEPYCAEGFLCWWERAADLSVLLTTLSETGAFADRLDLDRVFAAGFSLGGHAIFGLAGARSSLDVFLDWARSHTWALQGPKEFPDAVDHFPRLMETSDAFRASVARQSDDFSDSHVKRCVAIAPAPTVRSFLPETVRAISCPTTIISAGADQEAPKASCGDWLAGLNSSFAHIDMGPSVGHYTFLEFPAKRSLIGTVDLFTDPPDLDRAEIHHETARLVLEAFQ